MCGRFASPEQTAIERHWHVGRSNQPALATAPPFPARYNVAPQQGNPLHHIPVIRERDGGGLELVRMQWWLLPHWSRTPRISYSTFNARVESVRNAASFREPLKRRRCIVPALGWYEWQELSSGNLPWYLHSATGEILGLAALWDRWGKNDQIIESCALVVGPANASFSPIHDRMPFVLDSQRQLSWLDRSMVNSQAAFDLLTPNPEEAIVFHRVSTRVSNGRNEGRNLIEPLVAPVVEATRHEPPRRGAINPAPASSAALPLDFDGNTKDGSRE